MKKMTLLLLLTVLPGLVGNLRIFCLPVRPGPVAAQELSFSSQPLSETWTVTTRWDYRVRTGGRYTGLANRELREVYRRGEETPEGWQISGEARLLGETKRNGRPVAARLNGSESVSFILSPDGQILQEQNSYPRLRGFPAFPEEFPEPGDSWEAPLEILISGPENGRGIIEQTAIYTYSGIHPYMGSDSHVFDVQWAVRYGGEDPRINSFLNRLDGTHSVRLIVDAESGTPLMARDRFSETWAWAGLETEEREGFALMFWSGVPPLDTAEIRRDLEDLFADFSDDISVFETSGALSVTLNNLHFQPDLPDLLPEDLPLLDQLTRILSEIPERTVLIRGHTADTGRPEAEKSLSEQRAKTVADELSLRGINPGRLVFEGVGAAEPAASNATEAGKRRNRRVEFVIIED